MASIFSQIIRRKVPGELVYETDREIAFLDIFPTTEGHTLVVPKLEVSSFELLPPEDVDSLARAVQVVARGVTKAMGTPHYNLELNNGAPAGQVVFHVHFHVVPRYEGQTGKAGPLPPEKMKEIGAKIRAALQELGFPVPAGS